MKIFHSILFRGITTVFIFTLLCASCEKEALETSLSQDISVVDGRLIFKDESVFKATLANLYQNQDDLHQWERTNSNYTSLRSQLEIVATQDEELLMNNLNDYKYVFTLLDETNGEKSMQRNVYSDVMATVINHEGFLQIGMIVYRIDYNNKYSTSIEHIDLLKSNKIDETNTKIVVEKINRQFSFSDTNVEEKNYTEAECNSATSNGRRAKGLIVREEIWDHDCNIITKHQRKRFGIWWANSTSISVDFSGNFVKMFTSCNPVPNVFFSDSGSAGNSSSITRSVIDQDSDWGSCMSGTPSPFYDGQYISTHVAGGKTVEIKCPPWMSCTCN